MIARGVGDNQIYGAGVDALRANQRREHRVGNRSQPSLIDQGGARCRVGLPVIADIGAELLGQCQRGESGTA